MQWMFQILQKSSEDAFNKYICKHWARVKFQDFSSSAEKRQNLENQLIKTLDQRQWDKEKM